MPAVQKAVTYLDVDIFCRVIDNFGDAGVMWRLARALRTEGYAVRLIIDDPTTLCALAGCNSHTPIEKLAPMSPLTSVYGKRLGYGLLSPDSG